MNKKLKKFTPNYYSIILTGICCVIPMGTTVQAQVSLGSCSEIQNSDERLLCYDQAMSRNENLPVFRLPRSTRESTTSNSSTTTQTPSPTNETNIAIFNSNSEVDTFGMELKQERTVSESRRDYTVVAARHNDFTGWTIEFDNGSTWRQVGTDSFDIKVDSSYTIQRATLNSFLLSGTESNRKIRVTRTN